MSSLDPDKIEAELVAYYDGEGDHRLHRPIEPERVAARATFLRAISHGGPKSVLEIGSGPGRDARAFVEAGHRYVAVDLSFEHIRRCRAITARVARASVRRLPFRTASFDSIWTMSTLMHVPESAISQALSELSRVLNPGGLAAIGVWGGRDVEERRSEDILEGKPPRLFSRRSNERWRTMLTAVGDIEAFETWGHEHDFFYQWALLRSELRTQGRSMAG